jgi:hypothetical protein
MEAAARYLIRAIAFARDRKNIGASSHSVPHDPPRLPSDTSY